MPRRGKPGWWSAITERSTRIVYGFIDPRSARTHRNRSEGARRAWRTRKAREATEPIASVVVIPTGEPTNVAGRVIQDGAMEPRD